MRTHVIAVLALVVLIASTSTILLMQTAEHYGQLSPILLGAIAVATGMLIYAGVRESRLWLIGAALGVACCYIGLLASGH